MPARVSTRARSREKNRLFDFAVLAAVIIGAVGFARSRNVQVVERPLMVSEFDTVRVPVPVKFVPAGTKVADIPVKLVSYPSHQVPSGALTSLSEVASLTTLTSLPAELPLFRANFGRGSTGSNAVTDQIPQGMRAITVRVDATASVEGWAAAGSLVDVLLVENNRTTVVAERVRILSAERSISPVDASSSPNVPSTVTLLVTQDQTLAITTATPLGRISFALRSDADESSWASTTYTADRLKGQKIVTDKNGTITGYAAVETNGEHRSFALTNGKWHKAAGVPDGFLVNGERK